MSHSAFSDTRLFYLSPATEWTSALPLGNGRLGAMVFGGVERERLALNDDTFWMGVPHDYDRKDAAEVLPEIRRLLFAGREQEATALADARFMGSPGCQTAYQPLGDLILEFGVPREESSRYERALDLRTGIATVDSIVANGTERRETFVSHVDQVLVWRAETETPRDVNVEFVSRFGGTGGEVTQGLWLGTGQWINDGTERPWTADVREPGLRFAVGLKLRTDGVVEMGASGARVRGARRLEVVLAAATSFVNFQDVSGDPAAVVLDRLRRAAGLDHAELKARHVEDFSSVMDRCALRLGGAKEAAARPTDERLEAVKAGGEDAGLEALFFQYGRYLLASSSRPGSQPANLQGIWNEEIAPAWGSKWTTNVNLQMNYWHAETAGLADCHGPVFDLVDDLRLTGARTARRYYGARGWVLHHNADLWRGTAPVDGVWGIWPMGAAWLARHGWEHFLFSGDVAFLRERAWPAMKEAAWFVVDFLVKAPEGTAAAGCWVTCPSHSPENRFIRPDGSEGTFTYGATMDLMIIRELFGACRETMRILGLEAAEAELAGLISERLAGLAPLKISPRNGRLQEWTEDFEDAEPGHRHISHAYALYPGQEVSPQETPELAAALRKTLDLRLAHGGGGTGWSRAWLINLFARLGDGTGAREHLLALLRRCVLPNLFDTHPPFQIDGNFGAAAGVVEMLVQSRVGFEGGRMAESRIELLPALCAGWPEGEAHGLRARGGFTVGLRWAGGRLTEATLAASRAGEVRVIDGGKRVSLRMEAGETRTLGPGDFTAG